MGPRPFGRGRRPGTGGSPPLRGFNGAATFRSRKAEQVGARKRFTRGLQWGRDLSVAEGPKAGPIGPAPYFASMGPRPFGRGRQIWRGIATPSGRASMGPRPFGRGRLPDYTALIPWTSLQWGRDLSVAEGVWRGAHWRENMSFNGAATFRSRKGATSMSLFVARNLLQWGRDLSVAEGIILILAEPPADDASMGPRPFGRGRSSSILRSFALFVCFNGAATFRSRKGLGQGWVLDRGIASMGPRPFGRGRYIYHAFDKIEDPLQWGRDLSVAEGAA